MKGKNKAFIQNVHYMLFIDNENRGMRKRFQPENRRIEESACNGEMKNLKYEQKEKERMGEILLVSKAKILKKNKRYYTKTKL